MGTDGDEGGVTVKVSLKKVMAWGSAAVAVIGGISYALGNVVKPFVDSDPLPVASIQRVEKLADRIELVQAQQQRNFGEVQSTLDAHGRVLDGLLRQNLVQTYQYWQGQQTLATVALRRNPNDAAARSLLLLSQKNLADLTLQLNGKL